MYYEEKLIDGYMCYRTTPNGTWHPFALRELSLKYVQIKAELSKLIGVLAETEQRLNQLEGR